jgi:F-type H+-transporting ATPase subunit epsilon
VQVELVSPERILYSGEADMVVARTPDGEIAFLNDHAPFLGLLVPWPVRVISGDNEVTAAVHAGFVEVRDNRVIVLSDVAELAEEIDAARARAARERALEALERGSDDPEAREALIRANLRIEVAVSETR